jgi:hypothetical protein
MFNLPFGASPLQLMAPGLIPGPVPAVPLASGFHPPGTAGLGSLHMPQPEPGFNVKDGLALLSQGLAGFRPKKEEEPRPISPADAMAAFHSMPRSYTCRAWTAPRCRLAPIRTPC